MADFIGESNIIDGIMRTDGVVEIFNRRFQCLDKGFAPNEPVDVVIRPEDVDIVPEEQGQLKGTVTSVTFKGMQYDIIVDFYGFKWLIQTTDLSPGGQPYRHQDRSRRLPRDEEEPLLRHVWRLLLLQRGV